MSLPESKGFKFRGNRLLLILAAFVLVVPGVAFFVLTRAQTPSAQEPSKEYQAGKEAGANEARRREEREREMKEKGEGGPGFKAELAEKERREEIELTARATMQSALVNLAKITMEQAIHISTSQQPGKVLACSLVGEHWEAPGKLAKDGMVLYHTVIISGDEANPVTTHVLINALDGSVIKTEKEQRGKERTSGPVRSR